jgi:hypothetical protein
MSNLDALAFEDSRRLAREIDQCLPPDWDRAITDNPNMVRWSDELRFRLWKHKALLHRIGCVGPDWERFVEEVEAFTYANTSMLREAA